MANAKRWFVTSVAANNHTRIVDGTSPTGYSKNGDVWRGLYRAEVRLNAYFSEAQVSTKKPTKDITIKARKASKKSK